MEGRRRKTVALPTLKLSFVKAIKAAYGTTVNDVLLSATSGAIRRYCLLKEDPLFASSARSSSGASYSEGGISGKPQQSLRCRALIPVAFPRPVLDTGSVMPRFYCSSIYFVSQSHRVIHYAIFGVS